MARIKSSAIGVAKGSLGDLTYRILNGETVVSRRVFRNTSNTPKQAARRTGFGETVRLGGVLKDVIEIGFDKIKGGTKRNNFVSCNVDLRNYFSDPKAVLGDKDAGVSLYNALNDTQFLGQVMAAKGTMNVQSKFWETDEGGLHGNILLSKDFMAGDIISIGVCLIYSFDDSVISNVNIYSETVSKQFVKLLEDKTQFPVNEDTIPELKAFKKISNKEHYIGAVVTGIVSNDTGRSTSYFSVLKKETDNLND